MTTPATCLGLVLAGSPHKEVVKVREIQHLVLSTTLSPSR